MKRSLLINRTDRIAIDTEDSDISEERFLQRYLTQLADRTLAPHCVVAAILVWIGHARTSAVVAVDMLRQVGVLYFTRLPLNLSPPCSSAARATGFATAGTAQPYRTPESRRRVTRGSATAGTAQIGDALDERTINTRRPRPRSQLLPPIPRVMWQ